MNRLAVGLSAANTIVQSIIEQILRLVQRAQPYLDNVLVTGKTTTEHLANLRLCFDRLRDAGIRLKKEKCSFFQLEVEHLGHVIDEHGVRPSPKNSRALLEGPTPTDLKSLESWLCTAQYYQQFIWGFSTISGPLNELRKAGAIFHWKTSQQEAFTSLKNALASEPILVHYDDNQPLAMSADASQYGLGAVLFHVVNGVERPIAFASRTLTDTERRYGQIEREGAALIFGVKHFEKYLYGRQVKLYTDHRPLTHIFHLASAMPQISLTRLQRWALYLPNFDYEIVYRPCKDNFQADDMSRTPLKEGREIDAEVAIIQAEQIGSAPLDASLVKLQTRRDPILSRVLQRVLEGWPTTCVIENERSYWNRRNELTSEDGVRLWGTRVIVPPKLQRAVLEKLHDAHPGSMRCKQLARSYVWWPGLDAEIEQFVGVCAEWVEQRYELDRAVLTRWEFPASGWQRLHVDYAGPLFGWYWLVWIDAHTKYAGVHLIKNADSKSTIEALRPMFAHFGLPDQIVSDNGTLFVSVKFATFLRDNGVRHFRSAPHHPQTNGEAERFVGSLKKALKIGGAASREELELRVQRFLLKYRTTQHAITNRSPAEMLLGFRPTTRLDRLRPSLHRNVESASNARNKTREQVGQNRAFAVGDRVFVRFWYGN